MVEIFISDLDETLLNAEARVSEYSKGILQNLIERGLCFTVASARTPLSALYILDGIPLSKDSVSGVIGVIIKTESLY